MRRWIIATLLLLSLGYFGASLGTGQEKPAKQLSIAYHGNSFFILTTTKGTRIAFDPNGIPDYEAGRPKGLEADIILISHNHNDHTYVEALENHAKAKVLRGLKSPSLKADWANVDETINDVKIKSVGVYHDDAEGLMRGKNTIFIVEADGWRFAHLGDLGHLLTPSQLKRIGAVDVLMIPVGGIYTINGSEAKKVMAQIKPKEYVIPMHYGTAVFDATLPPDEFFEGQENRKVAKSDNNVLNFNKDANRPRPLTVQLHYWPKDENPKVEKKKS